MKKGIDISHHNGTIDMAKVKECGIDFIILRLGYRKSKNNIDKKFYENYNKAIQLKIPVGVYLYSYARNTEEAVKEAEFVISTIKNLSIDYPVFIDMEDADGYKKLNKVSYSMCIEICDTFCKYIENSGYYAGIYANLDWLNNKINDDKLDRFDKWVAQWSKHCTYKKEFGMWQYSSKGTILGINGNVDLNYAFRDYPAIIKENDLNGSKSKNIVYVVQKGDNLTKIAKKYNTTWQKIYESNKSIIGNNPNFIKVGQQLKIET